MKFKYIKRFFILLLFSGTFFYVQAGTNYLGANQLANLIDAIENVNTADAFTDAQPMRKVEWEANNAAAWWKIPGFCFTVSGKPIEPTEDNDTVSVVYGGSSSYYAYETLLPSGFIPLYARKEGTGTA